MLAIRGRQNKLAYEELEIPLGSGKGSRLYQCHTAQSGVILCKGSNVV